MLIVATETCRMLATIVRPYLREQFVCVTTDAAGRMPWMAKLARYGRQYGYGATTVVSCGEGAMYGEVETIAVQCYRYFNSMRTLAVSAVCNPEALQLPLTVRRLFVGEPLTERLLPRSMAIPLLDVLVIDHTSHLEHIAPVLQRAKGFGTQSMQSKRGHILASSFELRALTLRASELNACMGDKKDAPAASFAHLRSLTLLDAQEGTRLHMLPSSITSLTFVWRSEFWHVRADWRERGVAYVDATLERMIRSGAIPATLEEIVFIGSLTPPEPVKPAEAVVSRIAAMAIAFRQEVGGTVGDPCSALAELCVERGLRFRRLTRD